MRVTVTLLLNLYVSVNEAEDKLRHFRPTQFILYANQNATFSLLTYLRLTQFSYTEKANVPDELIALNEI